MTNLNDDQVYLKGELIGEGLHKKVYSIINHEDKVIKVGRNVIEEVKKFQNLPDLTPKVFYIDEKEKFVVVEKLDVERFKIMFKKNIIGKYIEVNFRSKSYLRRLLRKVNNDEDINFIYEFKNVIITTNVKDIHENNFGYDKNGVLKCLDLVD